MFENGHSLCALAHRRNGCAKRGPKKLNGKGIGAMADLVSDGSASELDHWLTNQGASQFV